MFVSHALRRTFPVTLGAVNSRHCAPAAGLSSYVGGNHYQSNQGAGGTTGSTLISSRQYHDSISRVHSRRKNVKEFYRQPVFTTVSSTRRNFHYTQLVEYTLADLLKEHKAFETGIRNPSNAGKLFSVLDVLVSNGDTTGGTDSGTSGLSLQKAILDELIDANLQELDDMYSIVALCVGDGAESVAKAQGCYDRIDEESTNSSSSIIDALKGYHTDSFQVVSLTNPNAFASVQGDVSTLLDELVRITKPTGFIGYTTSNTDTEYLTAIAEKEEELQEEGKWKFVETYVDEAMDVAISLYQVE